LVGFGFCGLATKNIFEFSSGLTKKAAQKPLMKV
jgi:hypothetical protein